MGCDIHFVVETRAMCWDDNLRDVPEQPTRWIGVFSTWQTPLLATGSTHVPNPGETVDHLGGIYSRMPAMKGRNYDFFAALAGVRGAGPEAKGVPDDASELTRYKIEREDGHSHSWDTLEDFARKWLLSAGDEATAAGVADMLKGGDELLCYIAGVSDREDLLNYRVVYWFDN